MTCQAKHTKYQPTDEEWKCRKCGSGPESFWIEESDPDKSDDCTLLHNDDSAICFKCGYSVSGKSFAAALQREHNLISCPHCKGTGLVPKGKGDGK